MSSPRLPLHYRISSWKQLPKCQSNNSRDLHISVTDFIQDDRLSGLRIEVNHKQFGTLFACLVSCKGSMISSTDEGFIFELTPDTILSELSKFGFNIKYYPTLSLSGDQIQLLMNVDSLGFDKVRILSVWDTVRGTKYFKHYVVAFKVDSNPDWINSGYSASKTEFANAVVEGSAFNITALSESKDFDWSWLYNKVLSVADILLDISMEGSVL